MSDPENIQVDGEDFGTLSSEPAPQNAPVEEGKHEGEGESQRKKPSLAWLFSDSLNSGNCRYRLRKEPGSGTPLVMYWTGSHWVKLSPGDRLKAGEAFARQFKSAYSAKLMKDCAELLGPALENQELYLKEYPTRNLIATRDHLLEIHQDGRIEVMKHDRDIFVPVFVDIKLEESRIYRDPKSASRFEDQKQYYRLRPVEVLESKGWWGKLVTSLFRDEEERRTFQRFYGLPFTRIRSQHVPILEGPPGRGKSMLLNVLYKSIAGSAALNLSSVRQFDLGQIVGAPVVVGDEIQGRLNEVLFKRISGGSAFTVEIKYMDPFSYTFDGFLFMAWNTAPAMSEHSGALAQRMIVFPCDGLAYRGTKKEQEGLDNLIVSEEQDLFFEWALHGACESVKHGVPRTEDLPARLKKAKERVALESDPMRGFVSDFEIAPGETLYTTDDLYELFQKWLKSEGMQPRAPMKKNIFAKHLIRVLEEQHGGDSIRKNMKPSVTHKGVKKRWPCYPLKLNSSEIIPLNRAEVLMNPDSYEDGKVPEELQREAKENEKEVRKLFEEPSN